MAAVLIGEPDHDIVACEEQLRAAQLGADVVVLERLLDDDLLFTGPDGRLATKEEDSETAVARRGRARQRVGWQTAHNARRRGMPNVAECQTARNAKRRELPNGANRK